MKNLHPDTEQLTGYMESPESSEHSTVRKHLIVCDQCRGRIDKLVSLEGDIKHYIPRLTQQREQDDNQDQVIERFMDKQSDDDESRSLKQKIKSDPKLLKAALHYAVHSAAMNREMSTFNSNANLDSNSGETRNSRAPSTTGSFFTQILKYLKWPAPVWAMAPATFLVATLVSMPFISSQNLSRNTGPQFAQFQDNAVISYAAADIPAGSIGFFHDAKARTEPFQGIDIKFSADKGLDLSWQAIDKANSYSLKIYEFDAGQKQEIVARTTTKTETNLSDIAWKNGRHYQWQLSGLTSDGLKFSTSGDFVFIGNSFN